MKTVNEILRSILLRIKCGNNEKKIFPSPEILSPNVTQKLITDLLLSDSPCLIARFGSVELQSIVDYLYPPTFHNAISFIKSDVPSWGYAPSTKRTMYINAGFFPIKTKLLNNFGKLMLDSMKEVDILGSWQDNENYVLKYMKQVKRVPLYSLEPYYFEDTWMRALEGKKVLVIHPFEDSILAQYKKWGKLFDNPQLQPNFKLLTLKAVQSIAGNKPDNFNNWFEALDWMKYEIDKLDFDIAIIGCGAYGFPLAAYVKRIGKKAIHLGGAVQYLFGIKSKAFDNNNKLNHLSNEYWVYPNDNEVIINSNLVEGGRYW